MTHATQHPWGATGKPGASGRRVSPPSLDIRNSPTARYLNLSELAYVRHCAAELVRRRRPRRAGRVRAFAANPRIHSEEQHSRSARPPLIPAPRRPLDTAPLEILHTVLAELQRLGVAA